MSPLSKSKNRRPLYMFSVTEEQLKAQAEVRERNLLGLEFVLKGGSPDEWAKKQGLSDNHARAAIMQMLELLWMQARKDDPTLVKPARFSVLAAQAPQWLDKYHTYKHKLQKQT